MTIQLIADPECQSFFAGYLKDLAGITLHGVGDVAPDLVLDACFLHPQRKLEQLAKLDTAAPILSNTLTVSATSARAAAAAGAGRPVVLIGLPLLPHYVARQTSLEYAHPHGVSGDDQVKGDKAIQGFLAATGKTGERINDAVGGVFPRTLAMIINEAAFAVQESVASAADIDTAMKLGTNYPKGPLAWCDEIGARAIVAILDGLAQEYGSERYRVAALLRRTAEAAGHFHA